MITFTFITFFILSLVFCICRVIFHLLLDIFSYGVAILASICIAILIIFLVSYIGTFFIALI